MPKTGKPNTAMALVSVLETDRGDAYAAAKQTVDSLPSLRLPAVVRKPEQQSLVVDMLRQVATAKSLVETKRKSVTKHLDAAKKSVMGLFRPMLKHLDDIRVDQEKKLDEYSDWQFDQQEAERERIRKAAEAQRRRADTIARKALEAAESRAKRKEIQAKLAAKVAVRQAVLEDQLAEVETAPVAEEGVAVIEDVEVEIIDRTLVPEIWVDNVLWTRQFNMKELKALGNSGVEVPGVQFNRLTRRAVKKL